MVAPNPTANTEHEAHSDAFTPAPARTSFLRLTRSLVNAAKLQKEILTLKAQVLAKKLVLTAMLGSGVLLLGFVGLVFCYIFIFKLLTDVAHIPAVWVWLIFAAAHVLAATTMGLIAANLWKEPKNHPVTPQQQPGAHSSTPDSKAHA